MLYTTLGRTGLRVSRMGLGCGGHSRLGLAGGGSGESAERIVKDALGLGVNFIDTAEFYGTEETVGRALVGVPRDSYVLSTKAHARAAGSGVGRVGSHANAGAVVSGVGERSRGAEFGRRVEAALGRLRTDYVDVFHLHGVSVEDYPYARDELYPALVSLRRQGKVRHIGITEAFGGDPSHKMLSMALPRDAGLWDVVMVGFSLLNPSARDSILPHTRETGIGTLCMFAVRRALSQAAALRELVGMLVAKGVVDPRDVDADGPLEFLVERGVASSIPEAAYRFCLHEPGLDVVLSGTGNAEHLRQNAGFLSGAPLPEAALARLREMFGKVDFVSGN